MTKKKEPCSVPLTSCCSINDGRETLSADGCGNDADFLKKSASENSFLVNGTSIFQGPNITVDIDFKDLIYDVRIKKNG